MVKRRDMEDQAVLEDASSGDSVDRRYGPAESQQEGGQAQQDEAAPDWLGIAKDAYEDSTTFMESSLKTQWERNERAFQNRHPNNSKYLSDDYRHRSKLFRPKTRSMVRAGEAGVAQAFFKNEEVMSVKPIDPRDKMQAAASEFWKGILQYRLTTPTKRIGIPWFMTLVGAYQDAQKYGVVVSKQWWEYREREVTMRVPSADGLGEEDVDGVEIIFDRPRMSLIPAENLRIDRGAAWDDPINSSPYCIVLHPMYIDDVEQRMETDDPKTGQPIWKKIGRAALKSAATRHLWDSTRAARESDRDDSKESEIAVDEYQMVWVHENFVRWRGEEYVYYTAGIHHLLSDPLPLDEVYPFCRGGERPVVMGYALLETHKTYPIGKPQLIQGLQQEANEIANLRIDNVKLAINKRFFVKRGAQVDLRSIVRGSASSITLVQDTEKDVREMETRDVTQSSYAEQTRIDLDIDDVAGNFSPGSIQGNRSLNETVGGMQLMAGAATQVNDLDMRVFTETWAEPALRQLLNMEQYFETDTVIMAIAGQQAQLIPKYGISEITDDFLEQELMLKINVGIGAADPDRQLQKLSVGADLLGKMFPPEILGPRLEFDEVVKEVFGNLGYRDGSRFVKLDGPDPMVQALQQQLQELQDKLDRKEIENKTKLEIGRMQSLSKILTQVVENIGNLEEGQQEFRFEQIKLLASMIDAASQQQMQSASDREARREDHGHQLGLEQIKGMFSLAQAKESAKNRPQSNGAAKK